MTLPVDRWVRNEVHRRDGWACRYCRVPLQGSPQLTIDHVVPVSKGGTNDPENLATCCRPCNERKGTRTGEEYVAWLEQAT